MAWLDLGLLLKKNVPPFQFTTKAGPGLAIDMALPLKMCHHASSLTWQGQAWLDQALPLYENVPPCQFIAMAGPGPLKKCAAFQFIAKAGPGLARHGSTLSFFIDK